MSPRLTMQGMRRMPKTKPPAKSRLVVKGDGYRIGDAETIRDLILWARKERINLSHVTVGQISLIMVDNAALGLELTRRGEETEPKGPGGLYEQYGGALLGAEGAPAAVETVEPTIEDDDE